VARIIADAAKFPDPEVLGGHGMQRTGERAPAKELFERKELHARMLAAFRDVEAAKLNRLEKVRLGVLRHRIVKSSVGKQQNPHWSHPSAGRRGQCRLKWGLH